MKETKYIKSPLNYTGGKYKLLSQILPLFPSNIHTFIDLFGGGFNVGINVNAEKIIYNDNLNQVVELLRYLKRTDVNIFIENVNDYIKKYNLSKENKDAYNNFRNYYNTENNSPVVFFTLLCYSFCNQIRFNKNNKYNVPCGHRNFNDSMKNNLLSFTNEIHKKNIRFYNKDFRDINIDNLPRDSFIYVDPPYYNSVATYSENNNWSYDDEKDLLEFLDNLNKNNIKFALSGNLKYENELLDEWKYKYNVHMLNYDYSNCNYQKKNKGKDFEVLITNYDSKEK